MNGPTKTADSCLGSLKYCLIEQVQSIEAALSYILHGNYHSLLIMTMVYVWNKVLTYDQNAGIHRHRARVAIELYLHGEEEL